MLLLSLMPFWHKHLFCQPAIQHHQCNSKISLTICSFPSFIYLHKYCFLSLPPLTCRCYLLAQKHGSSTSSYKNPSLFIMTWNLNHVFVFLPQSFCSASWLLFLYYVCRYVDLLYIFIFYQRTYYDSVNLCTHIYINTNFKRGAKLFQEQWYMSRVKLV